MSLVKKLNVDLGAADCTPAALSIRRGESWLLTARLRSGGRPLSPGSGATCTMLWRVAGSADGWWSASGTVDASAGEISASWTPVCDTGASEYEVFLRLDTTDGVNYSAGAVLRVLDSPGETPNELPPPTKVLDFGGLEVRNAPYWTKFESDNRFARTAAANTFTAGQTFGTVTANVSVTAFVYKTPVGTGETRASAWARYTASYNGANGTVDETLPAYLAARESAFADAAHTWSAAQTFTGDVTADHVYPSVVEIPTSGSRNRSEAWSCYMADYTVAGGGTVRDTLPSYIDSRFSAWETGNITSVVSEGTDKLPTSDAVYNALLMKADKTALSYEIVTPQQVQALPSSAYPFEVAFSGGSVEVTSASMIRLESGYPHNYEGYYLKVDLSSAGAEGFIVVGSFRSDTGAYLQDESGYMVNWQDSTSPTLESVLQLKDRAICKVTGAATINLALPDPNVVVSRWARDLIVDVDNSSGSAASQLEFSGLNDLFALRVKDGEDLADLTEIAAGTQARLLVTETGFTSGVLPVVELDRYDLDQPEVS